ncbi:SDR family oxidoreductase [Amycolatopsis taiwanensis]|uniref:SDR family oxidoreductase n=1 Tax=Amycolatopsis taiwanensis TaxID=342230 RepID=UPI001FDFFC78|nr:NAD(P)H-binding protein [Amycolatopsis taiwanensis]
MTTLVTGATGNVGRQVIAQLLDASDTAVRAVTRNPAAAGLPDGVVAVPADLAEPESLDGCLRGVDAVFLMWPLHSGEALPAVLDVIKRHAHRVVFLGSGGVRDLTMDQQQELIAQSGLEWTAIRPSTFAVNALWWAEQIRAGDVVRGVYGELGGRFTGHLRHDDDVAEAGGHLRCRGRYGGASTYFPAMGGRPRRRLRVNSVTVILVAATGFPIVSNGQLPM